MIIFSDTKPLQEKKAVTLPKTAYLILTTICGEISHVSGAEFSESEARRRMDTYGDPGPSAARMVVPYFSAECVAAMLADYAENLEDAIQRLRLQTGRAKAYSVMVDQAAHVMSETRGRKAI